MAQVSEHFIFCRFFVETTGSELASRIGSEICNTISHFGTAHVECVLPYWKISEYFEITIRLDTEKPSAETVRKIALKLGDGWDFGTPENAIWYSESLGEFFVDHVKWAHLEVIRIQ